MKPVLQRAEWTTTGRWRRVATVLTLVVLPCVARGEGLTVYGNLPGSPFTGGYANPWFGATGAFLNESGVLVGRVEKWNSSGLSIGSRALRLDGSGQPPTELPTLGASPIGFAGSAAMGINRDGTVVGVASKYSAAGKYLGITAARWDSPGGQLTELPDPFAAPGGIGRGPISTSASAINPRGTIVGSASREDIGGRGVRWDATTGEATVLGTLGTDRSGYGGSAAVLINDAGTIVGRSYRYEVGSTESKGFRAVRWDPGAVAPTELGRLTLNSRGSTNTVANAINAAGTIVGSAQRWGPHDSLMGDRPVRWDASGTAATELEMLGTDPNGGGYAGATAINDLGTAVGSSQRFDAAGRFLGTRAVRWDASGTAVTELGHLGTTTAGYAAASAYAINNAGVAVGSANRYDAAGQALGSRAAYWLADGAAVDLNDLIAPDAGWVLTEARAITDSGWVAGVGLFDPDGPGIAPTDYEMYLMHVPPLAAAPEPSTLAWCAGAATCLLGVRRRRGAQMSLRIE